MSEHNRIVLISGYIIWITFGVIIIRRGFIDKTCGYPMGAICLGLPWEFIFSFIEPQIPVMAWFNRFWFLCDCIILTLFIRYGRRYFPKNLSQTLFLPVLLTSLIVSFIGILCFTYQYGDLSGTYSAFYIQLIISLLFVIMIINRDNVDGQSIYAALAKMLGTLCFDIVSFQHNPTAKFLNFVYIISFLLDFIYFVLVYLKCVQLKISPWKRI